MPRPPSLITALAAEILDTAMRLTPGQWMDFPLPDSRFLASEVSRIVSSKAGARLGRGTFGTSRKAAPGKLRFTYYGPLED